MRLWSLSPVLLDRAALVAGWREGLLAQAVLAGATKGYRSHPQLERFRAADDPGVAISTYLAALAEEAGRRSYRFDRTRIAASPSDALSLTVTRGQLEFELHHLRAKVAARQPDWLPRLDADLRPHPMFVVVDGDIESWERPARP